MISEKDKNRIIEYARKYKVHTIILFGSSVEKDDARDIDIGVKGIEPRLFFDFYAELMRNLSKPVDIVDLSSECLFNKLVEERGIKIYG